MTSGWTYKDRERCKKLIGPLLTAFRKAVGQARQPTTPGTPLPKPEELAPGIFWRGNHPWGSDICILNRTLPDTSPDLLLDACNNEPAAVVALLKALPAATARVKRLTAERKKRAKKLEAEQHDSTRELHALFVAEELKDASKQ